MKTVVRRLLTLLAAALFLAGAAAGALSLHVDGSNRAGGAGRDEKRVVQLDGDAFTLRSAYASQGLGGVTLVWKRADWMAASKSAAAESVQTLVASRLNSRSAARLSRWRGSGAEPAATTGCATA
jgi:hypothetical protein